MHVVLRFFLTGLTPFPLQEGNTTVPETFRRRGKRGSESNTLLGNPRRPLTIETATMGRKPSSTIHLDLLQLTVKSHKFVRQQNTRSCSSYQSSFSRAGIREQQKHGVLGRICCAFCSVSNLDSRITGSLQHHRPVANRLRPCSKLPDVVSHLKPCPI